MANNKKKLLVVDDDAQIRDLLTDYLGEAGYEVITVGDGASAKNVLNQTAIDLMILDLILPDTDGVSLAREIRTKDDIPIIMLTTKSEEVERIVGLEVGADDYVSKPFSPRELLARIRAIFRRLDLARQRAIQGDDVRLVVRFSDWELDLTSRGLSHRSGKLVRLTNAEFNLLATFVKRPQRVLSRDQLLNFSRTDPDSVFDRSIDYLILRLRRKIEDNPRSPKLIRTEHGAGYVFSPKVVRI